LHLSGAKPSRPSAGLALCTFVSLLAILLLSRAGNLQAHQDLMQVVSVLLFAAAILSLRHPPGGRTGEAHSVSSWWLLPALVLGAVAYASVLPLGFISDDFTYLVWAPEPMAQILRTQFTQGTFGAFIRPLGIISLDLDYRMWHAWAPGWHLTSLGLHLAVAATVFYLCKELGNDGEVSGTAACIFAVLPVNTEAVAWVAARFDLV